MDRNVRASAGAWAEALRLMNAGNALQNSGDPTNLAPALEAYDAALAHFSLFPASAIWANSVGACWLNRGHVHLQQGSHQAAAADFIRAIEHLQSAISTSQDLAPRRNAAGAALNLARIRLAKTAEARQLVAQATAWLADDAQTDVIASTLALEAARLDLILRERELTAESWGEFTDCIEAALNLAATWLDQEHPTAAAMATNLFTLGAEAYARYQPQFILEFCREALDPTSGAAPFQHLTTCHESASRILAALTAHVNTSRVLTLENEASYNLLDLRDALCAPRPWLRIPENPPA